MASHVLKGKVALITGAAGGLGKAIASKFLSAGVKHVYICDISAPRLEEAIKELSSLGSVSSMKVDITQEKDVEVMFASAKDVSIVVNNAGIMDRFDPVGTLEKTLWDKVLAVNLTAPYLVSKHAIKAMEAGTGGVILNVGSTSSLMGFRAGAAYTASKHGLIGLTKNTAAFYAKKNIRCNCILPGVLEQTNIIDAFATGGPNTEGYELMMKSSAVEPKVNALADVADVVLSLCGDGSKVLNGAVIAADGGWTSY